MCVCAGAAVDALKSTSDLSVYPLVEITQMICTLDAGGKKDAEFVLESRMGNNRETVSSEGVVCCVCVCFCCCFFPSLCFWFYLHVTRYNITIIPYSELSAKSSIHNYDITYFIDYLISLSLAYLYFTCS